MISGQPRGQDLNRVCIANHSLHMEDTTILAERFHM
jgi:hypothetical protein